MSTFLTVKDIINTHAPVLTPSTQLHTAIDLFLEHNLNGAAVCDNNHRLVGFFSAHDVMTELWCQGYVPDSNVTIGDLMQREVISLTLEQNLSDVVELFALNKQQVYPTTAMGIATHLSTLSLEQRVKSCKVHHPQILPVIHEGQYIGLISRKEVLQALRTLFNDVPTQNVGASSSESNVV